MLQDCNVATLQQHNIMWLMDKGKQAGELRTDIDSRAAVLALIGMVNLAAMTAFHGMPVPETHTNDLLDLFLNGVART